MSSSVLPVRLMGRNELRMSVRPASEKPATQKLRWADFTREAQHPSVEWLLGEAKQQRTSRRVGSRGFAWEELDGMVIDEQLTQFFFMSS